MEQKSVVPNSKEHVTVFRKNADLDFLHDVLQQAVQKRFLLYGMPQERVQAYLQVYLEDIFSILSFHSQLKHALPSTVQGRLVKVSDFITSFLIPEFLTYILKLTDSDIENFLNEEINEAANKKTLCLLMNQLKESRKEKLNFLKKYKQSLVEDAKHTYSEKDVSVKWNLIIECAGKKQYFWEEVPDLPPIFIFIGVIAFLAKIVLYVGVPAKKNSDPEVLLDTSTLRDIKTMLDMGRLVCESFLYIYIMFISLIKLSKNSLASSRKDFSGFLEKVSDGYVAKYPKETFAPGSVMASILPLTSPSAATAVGIATAIGPEFSAGTKLPKRWQLPSPSSFWPSLSQPKPKGEDKKPKDEKQTEGNAVIRSAAATYIRLNTGNGMPTGTFFKVPYHDRKLTELVEPERAVQIVEQNPTVNPVDSESHGLKLLGKGEKAEFPGCTHKLKCKGDGSLRLGVVSKLPTTEDRAKLGVACTEILECDSRRVGKK